MLPLIPLIPSIQDWWKKVTGQTPTSSTSTGPNSTPQKPTGTQSFDIQAWITYFQSLAWQLLIWACLFTLLFIGLRTFLEEPQS